MKRGLTVFAAGLLVLCTLLAGCTQKDDTREYIESIGVVVTNNAGPVFTELFIFPDLDGHTDFTEEMGADLLANKGKVKRTGSYGVTLEKADAYGVVVRNNRGAVYVFRAVKLANADEAVVTMDSGKLTLQLYHRGGGMEEVPGSIVEPGDAPDHTQNPLKKPASYSFQVKNETDADISRITMREAAAPDKGEVELYLDKLEAGKDVTVSGVLTDADVPITAWLLYIQAADGVAALVETPFDPWTVQTVDIARDGDTFSIAAA